MEVNRKCVCEYSELPQTVEFFRKLPCVLYLIVYPRGGVVLEFIATEVHIVELATTEL